MKERRKKREDCGGFGSGHLGICVDGGVPNFFFSKAGTFLAGTKTGWISHANDEMQYSIQVYIFYTLALLGTP